MEFFFGGIVVGMVIMSSVIGLSAVLGREDLLANFLDKCFKVLDKITGWG